MEDMEELEDMQVYYIQAGLHLATLKQLDILVDLQSQDSVSLIYFR